VMEYYNTIQYDYNMIQGLYSIILFEEPTVWHFGCNTLKGLLTSAPASIVPKYWGVADSLSIEDIIGSIKFY
jgi:hypothetical protein